jgi:hypothetical protein
MSNGSKSVPISGLSGLQSLLAGASQGEAPLLSSVSSQVLAGGANQLVALGAAGHDITHAQAQEALHIWLLLDTSASMLGNEAKVVEGYNEMLNDLNRDSRKNEMMLSLWEFDSTLRLVHPAVPLAQVNRLSVGRPGPGEHQYNPQGGSTRLFQSWQEVLSAAIAHHHYNEEESPFPVPTTSLCIVITDGGENVLYGQQRQKVAGDVAKVASDLLQSERFILAFMGIDQNADPKRPQASHFWAPAKEIGFPDGAIGVDQNIARAFMRVSSSVRQVSSGKTQPGSTSTFFS